MRRERAAAAGSRTTSGSASTSAAHQHAAHHARERQQPRGATRAARGARGWPRSPAPRTGCAARLDNDERQRRGQDDAGLRRADQGQRSERQQRRRARRRRTGRRRAAARPAWRRRRPRGTAAGPSGCGSRSRRGTATGRRAPSPPATIHIGTAIRKAWSATHRPRVDLGRRAGERAVLRHEDARRAAGRPAIATARPPSSDALERLGAVVGKEAEVEQRREEVAGQHRRGLIAHASALPRSCRGSPGPAARSRLLRRAHERLLERAGPSRSKSATRRSSAIRPDERTTTREHSFSTMSKRCVLKRIIRPSRRAAAAACGAAGRR